MKERIVSVALRRGSYVFSLPAPARHGDCIYHPYITVDWGGRILPDEQGFLTNRGRYVGREEAAEIAVAARQIDKPQWGKQLFSEDLW